MPADYGDQSRYGRAKDATLVLAEGGGTTASCRCGWVKWSADERVARAAQKAHLEKCDQKRKMIRGKAKR